MDETQANGTQAGEAQWGEAEADDTLEHGDGNAGSDVEKLRRLRLSGFLRELVRVEGKMEAAELLGVNYKTLARAEKSGEITGRMGDALERLLGTGDDPEVVRLRASVVALEERITALEGGVKALAKEMRGGLCDRHRSAAVVKAGDGENGRVDGQPQAQAETGAGRSETKTAPPVAGLRPKKPFAARRLDPEIVTEEPADDDPEVYGTAWPLVEEWRRLRVDHPRQGKSLSWLVTEKRLLTLELAMLDDHGLTLPPEKQPLRGFGRKGQTNWRRKALYDTRVALRKRELLRWVRRVCTLGLWRK